MRQITAKLRTSRTMTHLSLNSTAGVEYMAKQVRLPPGPPDLLTGPDPVNRVRGPSGNALPHNFVECFELRVRLPEWSTSTNDARKAGASKRSNERGALLFLRRTLFLIGGCHGQQVAIFESDEPAAAGYRC
jgi:hypothetical protein